MLKIGSTGIEVRTLQRLLNEAGHRPALALDGHFGLRTRAAVMDRQRALGLVIDGVAGPKTVTTLSHRAKPAWILGEADLARAADRLGVPIAAVKAVNEVESRGEGFLQDMRPVILFERHIMYRQLSAARLDTDADVYAALFPAIVNRTRGGYVGGMGEHRRLRLACEIHLPSAIESASWGLFQIMGFHWQGLGYDSPVHFEQLMNRSEADQLDAFVRLILATPAMHKALKARKWANFAAVYNGPAYKDNLYDVKLARAFERHANPEPLEA